MRGVPERWNQGRVGGVESEQEIGELEKVPTGETGILVAVMRSSDCSHGHFFSQTDLLTLKKILST